MDREFRNMYNDYVASERLFGRGYHTITYDEWVVPYLNNRTAVHQRNRSRLVSLPEYGIQLHVTEAEVHEEIASMEFFVDLIDKNDPLISVIECNICTQNCRNAVAQKCGHVHCIECLSKVRGFRCPVCGVGFKFKDLVRIFH
jgi:hypothetical protein